jgi:hypothetical protein
VIDFVGVALAEMERGGLEGGGHSLLVFSVQFSGVGKWPDVT